jgi:hypothetical protein
MKMNRYAKRRSLTAGLKDIMEGRNKTGGIWICFQNYNYDYLRSP